jgi:hypothetical protein
MGGWERKVWVRMSFENYGKLHALMNADASASEWKEGLDEWLSGVKDCRPTVSERTVTVTVTATATPIETDRLAKPTEAISETERREDMKVWFIDTFLRLLTEWADEPDERVVEEESIEESTERPDRAYNPQLEAMRRRT